MSSLVKGGGALQDYLVIILVTTTPSTATYIKKFDYMEQLSLSKYLLIIRHLVSVKKYVSRTWKY